MYNKIKKCTIVASIMAVNNLHSMQNLVNFFSNISSSPQVQQSVQQLGNFISSPQVQQVGQHFSNFMNSQQGQQLVQHVENFIDSQEGQQIKQAAENGLNFIVSKTREEILKTINELLFYKVKTKKNIIYNQQDSDNMINNNMNNYNMMNNNMNNYNMMNNNMNNYNMMNNNMNNYNMMNNNMMNNNMINNNMMNNSMMNNNMMNNNMMNNNMINNNMINNNMINNNMINNNMINNNMINNNMINNNMINNNMINNNMINNNKHGRLVIYIPGQGESNENAEKTIVKEVRNNNYLANADIMLLDYHDNIGKIDDNFWNICFKDENYTKDILNLDNFFLAVKESKFYEKSFKNIKEVIIMGYSLGCLYANKLVDKIYEGYFNEYFNENVTVSLVMIKPFINLCNCLKNFTGFDINLINNDLVTDLSKKTSNYEILKNRCNENRYNTRKPILICCQKKEDHGITSEDIEHCLNFYNDTVYTKSVDGLCYKRSLTIILTGEYDNIVSNSIVQKLIEFNGSEMCY